MDIEKAKSFVKENARPVELALYEYFFEGGAAQRVVDELAAYQNPDGGFGHGLEADNWDPNSNPIATNDAIITLSRVGALDAQLPMVRGIVRWLGSHDSFDEQRRRWLFAVDSTKDFPHAIWWEKNDDGINGFNPTVSLAAFMLCFGGEDDGGYYTQIVREGFDELFAVDKLMTDSMKCYLLAFSLLRRGGIDIIDFDKAAARMRELIGNDICPDTSKYGVEYVSAPSDYFAGCYLEFSEELDPALIRAEQDALGRIQQEDGGFPVSWRWYTAYDAEYAESCRMWRPRITLDKLLFVRSFSAE